jgi:glycerophosphoryl diester phosphodiesterase
VWRIPRPRPTPGRSPDEEEKRQEEKMSSISGGVPSRWKYIMSKVSSCRTPFQSKVDDPRSLLPIFYKLRSFFGIIMLYTAIATTLFFGLGSALPADGSLDARTPHHGVTRPLNVQVGDRPYYLIDNMDAGPLKDKLASCKEGPFKTSSFSIGHRGAALQFPEHTAESYKAAARQGAGVIECDVAFTKDKKLVCRHSQCDLHTTTNILQVPALAAKCTKPFTPASPGVPASANCCTSDLTLAEFKTLCGRMDGTPNPNATSVANYLSTPAWRTDL